MKIHKLGIFFLLALFSVHFVHAEIYDFEYVINMSMLPFNVQQTLSITNNFTQPLNYSVGHNDSFSLISFENNFSLNVNETKLLVINVSLLTEIKENVFTDYVVVRDNFGFVVLNNSFLFNVTSPIQVDKFIAIDINKYELNVCDFVLPQNRTQEVRVNADALSIVKVSCTGEFVSCPNETVIGADNFSNIFFDIFIPQNKTFGTYPNEVLFDLNTTNNKVMYTVKIIKCSLPSINVDRYLAECRNTSTIFNEDGSFNDAYFRCLASVAALFDELNKRAEEAKKPIIINETKVEYVDRPVYNTEEFVGKITDTLVNNQNEISGGINQSATVNTDNLEQLIREQISSLYARLKSDQELTEKKFPVLFTVIIGIILIVLLTSGYVVYRYKSSVVP